VNYLQTKRLGKKDKEIIQSKIWFDRERIIVKCKYLLGILGRIKGEAIKKRNYSKILSDEDIAITQDVNDALRIDLSIGQLTYNIK